MPLARRFLPLLCPRALRPLFILFGLIVSASAHALFQRQSLPTCAEACVAQAATAATSCSSGSEECYCTSSAFLQTAVSCVESSCDASDAATALTEAAALCAAAGVTIDPASLTAGATVAPSSGSASSTASAATTTPASSMSGMSMSGSTPSTTSPSAAATSKSAASANMKTHLTLTGLVALFGFAATL